MGIFYKVFIYFELVYVDGSTASLIDACRWMQSSSQLDNKYKYVAVFELPASVTLSIIHVENIFFLQMEKRTVIYSELSIYLSIHRQAVYLHSSI